MNQIIIIRFPECKSTEIIYLPVFFYRLHFQLMVLTLKLFHQLPLHQAQHLLQQVQHLHKQVKLLHQLEVQQLLHQARHLLHPLQILSQINNHNNQILLVKMDKFGSPWMHLYYLLALIMRTSTIVVFLIIAL